MKRVFFCFVLITQIFYSNAQVPKFQLGIETANNIVLSNIGSLEFSQRKSFDSVFYRNGFPTQYGSERKKEDYFHYSPMVNSFIIQMRFITPWINY